MPDLTFSPLAAALRPAFSAAIRHFTRLHEERSAARTAYNADLLNHTLGDTYSRLKGGHITDTWWRNLLAIVGHKYIAPEFLQVHAIREWLSQETVEADFRNIAAQLVMGVSRERTDERERLAEEYSKYTGEHQRLADGPIDVVTGILVAGFLASIPSSQRPIAGMLQQMHGSFNERLDDFGEKHIAAVADLVTERFPIVQQVLTPHAEGELGDILSLRALDQVGARQRIQQLFKRVSSGDLSAIEESSKHKIYQWAARLCATQKETLPFAKEIRDRLAENESGCDLSVIDALICETEGDIEGALRGLRDAGDRDSRSVWFGILMRAKGEEKALEWFDEARVCDYERFFSGAGWVNWAIASAKCGKWSHAAEVLKVLQNLWEETPALPIVEGSVNAAFLLPDDLRIRVLDGVPLYHGIMPISGSEAAGRHARSIKCFQYAEHNLRDRVSEDWVKCLADWFLWLRLMEPDIGARTAAHENLKAEMKDGEKALVLVPFAHSFGVDYDPEPLEAYIETRKELGGHDDRTQLAEFIVNAQFMESKEFVEYFDRNHDNIVRIVPPEFMATTHVQSILEDEGSSEDARKAIEQYRESLDEHHAKRLEMMIDAHEGHDVRRKLEELYERTGNTADLWNLIEFLKRRNDREALKPLCLELFRRLPTVERAIDVVTSLSGSSSQDYDNVISFLDENEHLLEDSERLLNAKSIALIQAGRYAEAQDANERSRKRRRTSENLQLGAKIAIASGDWEAIGGILAEAWALRDEHDANSLVSLAHLAGQQSQTRDQGLQLLRLAAEKAPDDAAVLAAVYWQHFQFGREEDANPRWLSRALELSTDEEGPIRTMSLPDIAEDWLPKHRDHLIEVDRKWVQGEIPISVVADKFNVSLSRMLLYSPTKSADEPDGRRRMALPVVAAARPDTEMDKNWTIGIDVTSVLILQYLDILEKVLGTFRHIKFSPDIFEHLFRERTEARFHQPSRIALAKRVLRMHGRERIKVLESEQAPPSSLIDEIGRETAEVLQWAKNVDGIAVCIRPIHAAGSLGQREADLGSYHRITVSLRSFSKWLRDAGKIGSDVYGRICTVLRNSGDAEDPLVPENLAQKPVCFDGLALRYLADASSLQPVVSVLGVIRIHYNIFQEMRALTEEGESEEEIVASIDGIRHTIKALLQEGKASFLPRPSTQFTTGAKRSFRLEATASLLEGSVECDALCIDDRFMNSHLTITGPDGKAKPILSVLDNIRHLVNLERITHDDYYGIRHKLRAGGFAFVPLEAEEICQWLRGTQGEDGQAAEAAELRVLRQTAARDDSLALTNWNQAFALASNSRAASTEAISALWNDAELTPEEIMVCTDWIWRNLMATAVPGHQLLDYESYGRLVSEIVSWRIGSLLLPLPSRSKERRGAYIRWIEHTVLQRLRPANADRIRAALMHSKEAIASLEVSQAAYGNLFLEQLPDKARALIIRDDPEFAEKCGYRAEQVFSIGPSLQLVDRNLFGATAEALREGSVAIALDVTGTEVSVVYDREGQQIQVSWLDREGAKQEAAIGDLCVLSPSVEVRQATFRRITERLGPTFDFDDQLKSAISLKLPESSTVSRIFDESFNGFAAIQANTEEKILGGKEMSPSDFVPESMEYFERFVAPVPDRQEIGSFLSESLPQYRRGLLARNLKGGLRISCLGALHDDLSPGQWLTEETDDSVWSALEAASSGFNPFSQLGALDVALHRQHDQRFRTFASKAVEQLLHGNFGFAEEMDVYRLLQILADFVLNRINLLEEGATKPGYWKRIGAWMQAGYIVETMLKSGYAVSSDMLEEWTHENMAAAGAYASLIDAKTEPMLSAARVMSSSVRYEVLGRLEVLRRRHEKNGREVPGADLIDRQLEELEKTGLIPALWLPGPLEGDRTPSGAPPGHVEEEIEKMAAAEDGNVVSFLVTLSQLYSLNERQIELARLAIEKACDKALEKDVKGVMQILEHASIVAATNRSASLSASVGEGIIRISSLLTELEVASIPRILLQAAVAFHEEREWYSWLDKKLVEVVGQLPSHPSPSLRTLLGHLDEIEIILPTTRWFHVRARSAALVGAV